MLALGLLVLIVVFGVALAVQTKRYAQYLRLAESLRTDLQRANDERSVMRSECAEATLALAEARSEIDRLTSALDEEHDRLERCKTEHQALEHELAALRGSLQRSDVRQRAAIEGGEAISKEMLADIGRLRGLIDDAIARLVASFTSLEACMTASDRLG